MRSKPSKTSMSDETILFRASSVSKLFAIQSTKQLFFRA
jgi:hypothetical protein